MSINNYMSNNNAVEILTDYAGAINVKLTQCSTMPTASIDNLNLIIQYIGATTNNYTNGYFYKCIEDPETSGSYIWTMMDIQPNEVLVINATLLASGWDANNRQALTFNGYNTGANGIIGMPSTVTVAQREAYSTSVIRIYSTSDSLITFECENVPLIDLPVTLISGGIGNTSGAVSSVNGKTGTVILSASDISGLGTASGKNFANSVISGSNDLPTGGAVYTAIQDALNAYGIAEETSF